MLLLLLRIVAIGGALVVSKFLFLLLIVAISVAMFSRSGRTLRAVIGLTNSNGTRSSGLLQPGASDIVGSSFLPGWSR